MHVIRQSPYVDANHALLGSAFISTLSKLYWAEPQRHTLNFIEQSSYPKVNQASLSRPFTLMSGMLYCQSGLIRQTIHTDTSQVSSGLGGGVGIRDCKWHSMTSLVMAKLEQPRALVAGQNRIKTASQAIITALQVVGGKIASWLLEEKRINGGVKSDCKRWPHYWWKRLHLVVVTALEELTVLEMVTRIGDGNHIEDGDRIGSGNR